MTAHSPTLSYWTVQPNRWTFEAPKIRDWVKHHMTGRTLNMCAGPTVLSHDGEIIRNDLNPDVEADTHADARTLDDLFDANSFDTILYDPPFSKNQAETTYNISEAPTDHSSIQDTIDTLLKPGGTLIHFGFDSTVMPASYHYETEEIALWNNLGGQYDWLSGVERKPATPTHPRAASTTEPSTDGTPVLSAKTSTHPNARIGEATANTDATTGGNNGTPLTFEYYRYPEQTDLREAVENYLSDTVNGRTLDVCHTSRSLSSADFLHKNALRNSLEADSYHAPQRLSHEFADHVFDTVVLDPEPAAFQRHLSYHARDMVEATVLKLELHPLLKANATVVQVAHTATCMRSQLNYLRTNVAVFSSPTASKDFIVTTDEKQPTPSTEQSFKRVPEDSGVPDEIATANVRHVCIRCGEGYYHHPAWYVDCLKCGALPDNYCVTPDGTVRHTPHQHRLDVLEKQHQNCISDDDLLSQPPVPFDDQQANSGTAQTSLTGIVQANQD